MGLHTIDHLRTAARKRLPRVAFDFMDGGSGRESALARNMAAYERLRLLPRALVNCTTRSQVTTLFGRRYAHPFAVAPVGMANMIWPGTDLALARAAAAADIPYLLSTAATTPLETIVEAAGSHAWFQLYVGRDAPIVDDLVQRAIAADVPVLVVTVDVPIPGKRVRDLQNGFTLPFRLHARGALDVALHPAWAMATLRSGAPRFANLERYAKPAASTGSLAAFMGSQSSARLDWALLREIRAVWPRTLLVKGILNPADAREVVALGADGLVVSNHGGRQLDGAPAPIEMLPAIRTAVGSDFPVLLDGGIRTGEDIAKGLAAGADFVLLARAFLYGIGALGPVKGPAATLAILTDELDRALVQLGCTSLDQLSPDFLVRPDSASSGQATAYWK